jgi:nanoRNase/pAp phosphatase (c-di-AMP/oligoRNAs hydrolase)
MKSLFYVEEDFVAGLLKDYFAATSRGDSANFIRRGSNGLADRLSKDSIDLFLAQSEDPAKLTRILELVRRQGRRIPTLLLTSHSNEIPLALKSLAHCVSIKELLESSLRWHMRLARTQRWFDEVRAHFAQAERVAILLQDDPDPDAIGSGLALRQVLGRNKQTAPLVTFGRVTRPENIAMVKLLEIEMERVTERTLKHFDRIAVVDLQPPHLAHPPEHVDLVIDHHPEQFNYHAHIKDIRPGYGATASILFEYLRCADATIGTRLATAMLYGIKSDTFLLTRDANEWDIEAFSYLYPLANQNLMRRIERPELPPAALDALSIALKNRQVVDKVAFVHLGRVERDDLIPQIADFSLQFEGIEWACVSGIFESNYIMSIRNVGYVRAAGRVAKEAFGDIGSAGGHASMAKAIIPLAKIARKWEIEPRNIRSINARAQREFLKALRAEHKS